MLGLLFMPYQPPKGAQGNAKKVLRWREEHGNEVKGMTSVGWRRARQLASGQKISLETVKRMAQFNRHRKNAKIDPKYKDTPWKDNGYVAWLGWGGDSGINWALKITQSMKNKKLTEGDSLRVMSLATELDNRVDDINLSTKKFEILKVGEYFDSRYGQFQITEERLHILKENFDANVLEIDVAIDVNHDPTKGAFAWINTLSVEGGKLYMTLKDVTEKGREILQQKVFKYFSVEFSPFTKVVDGKKMTIQDVLRGVALTNRPVIKGMSPTFLSEEVNNSLINPQAMEFIHEFAEKLLAADEIMPENVQYLRRMLSDLSPEEKTEELEAKVAEVEAKAEGAESEEEAPEVEAETSEEAPEAVEASEGEDSEESEEASESTEVEEEAGEEVEEAPAEEAEEGDATPEEASEEETPEEGAELSEEAEEATPEAETEEVAEEAAEPEELEASESISLSEFKAIQEERDMLLAEKREATLDERVKGLILSEGEGFSDDAEEDVRSFIGQLSDDQFAQFSELLKRYVSVAKFGEEIGSNVEGESNDEDAKLKRAEKLAEQYVRDGLSTEVAMTKAQKEVFNN